jgi:hypothetical protein
MDKEAWRSVSKKSKEIVLKKDEEKDRPIVIVKDKEEGLKKKGKEIEKTGPEPEDELNVGDIRYYLNRNNRDIVIRIARMDDDGSVYAETFREKTPFKIPANRIRNIGEKLTPEELQKLQKPRPIIPPTPIAKPKTVAPEMKPVTPTSPEGEAEEVIELKPIEDIETKEPPEEVEDREDAEELLK